MRQGRIKQSTNSQQMHCRTFSNCTRGSDASKVWNAAECKCALEALLKGVLPKGPTEQHRHLNLNKTRENHRNTLKNFILRGLNKHFSWFRCGGKGKHLNLALRQNQAVNPLTTNALQDFQQLYPRFRSQTGLEGNRLQMRPGGASGWGFHKTCSKTARGI